MGIKNSLTDRTSVSVASIKNVGKSIVSFTLSELDINKVSVGQKVNINFSNGDVKNFTAEVAGIDRVGSVSNNLAQYSVIVRINEESDKILPNMKMDGEIIINEKSDVLLVPSASIRNEKGKNYVVLDDGTKKEVTTGISNGSLTEVIGGVKEGDSLRVEALPTTGFINTNSNSNIRVPGLFGR
jgi:HlyD family secretion protein